MLDRKINAKNHPDWEATETDEQEEERLVWIADKIDADLYDSEMLDNFFGSLSYIELERIGTLICRSQNIPSPHKQEAWTKIGEIIATNAIDYFKTMAEYAWRNK